MISASDFSARHLLMALDAGEPYRIARAHGASSRSPEAPIRAARSMSRRLVEQSRTLAKSVGNPHAIAVSLLADGMHAMARGEWKRALTSRRTGADDPARPVRRASRGN